VTRVTDITGEAIQRIYADAQAIFTDTTLGEGVTVPRVTLDLPTTDPEPFHVFVWGQAREFTNVGFLTRDVYLVSFKVRMTLVASGSTTEDAASTANEYLAAAVQITLCDTQLGGAVDEIGIPQITLSEAWADQSGRRHAGYAIEYECSKTVAADPAIKSLLGGTE